MQLSDSEGLAFSSNGDGTCYVLGLGTCTDEHIVIPEYSPNGDKVIGIGDFAFYQCGSMYSYYNTGRYALKSIVIPEGVTYIGDHAFDGCEMLEKVTLPDSLERVGVHVFPTSYIHSLKYITYENAKYIGSESNPYLLLLDSTDKYITSCNIHEDTKIIAGAAFYACDIESIIIPENVDFIGSGVFSDCDSLKHVSISGSFKYLDGSAFSGCDNLVLNEYDNAYYLGNDNDPYIFLVKAKNTSITSCEIYSGTKAIGSYAFSSCGSLTAITIPDGVVSIGEDAFYDCKSLASVNIPDGIEIIERSTFYNCDSLTEIIIPDSVIRISPMAFKGCNNLKNVSMSKSIEYIDSYAFDSCSVLENFEIPNSIKSISTSVFDSCHKFSYNKYGGAYYLGNAENPYLVLMSSVTDVMSLMEINGSTKVIAAGAFSDCDKLKSITIPEGVEYICGGAFGKCESIVLPSSLKKLNESMFENSESLETIYFTGSEEEWMMLMDGDFRYGDPLENITVIYNYVPSNENNLAIGIKKGE